MEEQLGAGVAEWQIAKFIDHDQIVPQQFLGQPAALLPAAFSCSSWFTRSTRLKNRPLVRVRIVSRRKATANAEMGFAGAGAADEDGVTLGVEERTGRQLTKLSHLVDRRVGKDEAVEILQDRELWRR